MKGAAFAIATVAFLGKSPWAPGTVGSLASLGCFFLWGSSTTGTTFILGLYLLPVALLPLGIWAAGRVEASEGKDSQIIVVDEFLGQWLAFLWIPQSALANHPTLFLAGLVLFRFFDITKVLGISRMEKLGGGVGIMADDVLAGLYASLGVGSLYWLLEK